MRPNPDDAAPRRVRPATAGVALALAVALGLGGCVGAASPSAPPEATGSPLPSPTATPSGSDEPPPGSPSERPAASVPAGAATLPPSGAPVTGEVPEAVLASILEDAARRTGADPATAKVVRAEAVTWSDGSLGCPEPGMFYTQALVDGYWVVVELGGVTLDYRVGSRGAFRLCEQPSPGAP